MSDKAYRQYVIWGKNGEWLVLPVGAPYDAASSAKRLIDGKKILKFSTVATRFGGYTKPTWPWSGWYRKHREAWIKRQARQPPIYGGPPLMFFRNRKLQFQWDAFAKRPGQDQHGIFYHFGEIDRFMALPSPPTWGPLDYQAELRHRQRRDR